MKNQRDINLANMRISYLGEAGMINKCIPDTYNLYLDKNLLYSWDQYFEIIKQLPSLRIIVLTGNRFRKIPPNYLEGKDVADLVHHSLCELVLIDMALDWEQIDILAPVLTSCEHLHLVNNKCSKIFSLYKVPTEHFKNLKMVNLEDNNIASWDEVIEFRHLENLEKLILSRNKIPRIYH